MISRIRERLTRLRASSMVRGFAQLATGAAAAQILLLLVLPVLTRLYTPAEIGLWGTYMTFVGWLLLSNNLRYELGVISARDRAEAYHLTCAAVVLPVVLSIPGALLFRELIGRGVLDYGRFAPGDAWLAIPVLVVGGGYVAIRSWFLFAAGYRAVGGATVLVSIGRVGSQLALGAAGFGWLALVVSEAVAFASGALWLLARNVPTLPPFRVADMLAACRRWWKCPAFVTPSGVFDMIALTLPIPIISTLFGIEAAGMYVLAHKIVSLPISFVARNVGDVFHVNLASALRDDPKAVRGLFVSTSRGLLRLGIGPAAAAALAAPMLLPMALGDAWRPTGLMVAYLVPWGLAQLVVSPVSRALFVLGRQETKFIYDGVSLSAVFAGLYGGAHFGLDLLQSVVLLSLLKVFAYVVYFVLLLWFVDRASPGDGDSVDPSEQTV